MGRRLYMGGQRTFDGIARVVFPVLGGVLFDFRTGLPLVLAALLVAGTLLLGRALNSVVPERK